MTFEDRVSEHRVRAAAALQQRRWADAQAELDALLGLMPDDAMAWNDLGIALERQHKQREAVEAYARAARLQPGRRLPARNLVRNMQSYLGFGVALFLFTVVDVTLRLLPISSTVRTTAAIVAFVFLAFGALLYYQRQRDHLPRDAWQAYKSELARTRMARYGGMAFVFLGFLLFVVVLFGLMVFPGRGGDGAVVLVVVAGFCWLIVARLLWRRIVGPRLDRRSGAGN